MSVVVYWDIIQPKDLQDKLDEILSPRLIELGLVWRGDKAWVEPGPVPLRRMIRLIPLKGLRAVIGWGYSLNFVPHLTGTELRYHRTFKSAPLDVFEWPASHMNSLPERKASESVSLLAAKFETSLKSFLDAELPSVALWFKNVRGLPGIEQELRRQIARPLFAYRAHHPLPSYVLPFVVAARGEILEAEKLAETGFTKDIAPLLPKLRLSLQRAASASPPES